MIWYDFGPIRTSGSIVSTLTLHSLTGTLKGPGSFVTDASGPTWWPNWESMQVAFFLLAEEITQVKEAIPWVRCASGNVFTLSVVFSLLIFVLNVF